MTNLNTIDNVIDIDAIENLRQTKLVRAIIWVILVTACIIFPIDIYLNGLIAWENAVRLLMILFCVICLFYIRKNDPQRTKMMLIGFALIWLFFPTFRFWNDVENIQFYMFLGPMIFAGLTLNKKWATFISLLVLIVCISFTIQISANNSSAISNINFIRSTIVAYIISIWLILSNFKSGFNHVRTQIESQSQTLRDSLKATKISQNKFATLVENAPEAILLFDRETFAIQLANDRACDLIGLTKEEIIAGGTQLILPANINTDLYRHLLQSNTSNLTKENEVRKAKFGAIVTHANNTNIPCEVEMVKFDFEHESLFRVSLFDIRERQEQVENIKRQANIIQRVNDAVYTTDENSIIDSWNRAAESLYGWSEDEAIGQNARELLTRDTSSEIVNERIHASATKGYWQGELHHYHKTGDLLELGASLTSLRDEHSALSGFIVITNDISEQKKATEALTQSQRVKQLGVLAGSIAHDFNNLLAAIQLEGSIAEHQLDSSHPAHQNLARMNSVAEKAGLLISQMLAYSGKGQTAVTQFDLNDLLKENLQGLQSSIPPIIQLGLHFDDNLSPIDGDRTQIHQVTMNLLLNAVDSIGEIVGRIDIQTEHKFMSSDGQQYWQFSGNPIKEGHYNIVHFIDSGSGIDDETLEQIFDPFFSTKQGGSGLGLAAVLGIMRGHNGGIHVYSKPEIGSKFSLYFPAAVEPAEDDCNVVKDNSLTLPPFSKKVLVVDDDEDVQTAVCSTFDLFNIPFIQAKGGKAGIELFTQHQNEIGLVFLDMKMPDIDGDSVYKAISQIDPNINVLVSSGYHESEIMPLFIGSSKHVTFIPKPFNINALINALQEPLKTS